MMTELQEYPWPGNVRELKNVVDRAVIHCAKPKLNLAEKLHITISETDAEEWKSLGDYEIDYIVRVLEKTKWRINGPKGAAAILDLNPSTLRSRMRKLGIKKA
jgi:transcriptional regulator with GAF, ATPase, and Fis domain